MAQSQKPKFADAVYYDELKSALKQISKMYVSDGKVEPFWWGTIQWKGVTPYPSYESWLEDVTHIKNEMSRLENEYINDKFYLNK